jgi:hydroxyacylglutathione hydrolase
MKTRAPLCLGLISFFAIADLGCASSQVVGRTKEGASIVQIPLALSNAFLIKSKTPVMIDAGSEEDLGALTDAIEANGVTMNDVGLMVLTHAHSDHVGRAAELQRTSKAKLLLGAGDFDLAREGHNDELKPMNATAHFLKHCIVPHTFPRFIPNYTASEPVDLAPWGIDGKVVPMPGHTAGSLVVVLANKSAFVGDMILGGNFGGALWPQSPGAHYFHADLERNRQNIAALLKQGVETFYLGHGGPVTRADVIEAFSL